VLVILAFALIAIRGLRVADRAPDTFGALIAVGITTWICGQAFINIGVVLAVLPVTGVPLPFVSQGGSALIVLLAAIGLLLSVSRETMGEADQGGTDARFDRGRWNRGAPVPRVRYRSFAPPSPYQR
jgi:cell division protein FtsW